MNGAFDETILAFGGLPEKRHPSGTATCEFRGY
jgi:hypothetical protein